MLSGSENFRENYPSVFGLKGNTFAFVSPFNRLKCLIKSAAPHRVSGNPIAIATQIIKASAPEAVEVAPVAADRMICLSERKAEFVEATLRGKDNRLEVYAGWDKDSFVVVNRDNSTKYEVRLETRNGRTFADCTCKDFFLRKRICKHQSAVLVDMLISVSVNI